jgi:hypothetical protein
MKEQFYPVLFTGCLDAANLLIGNCELSGKLNSFVNKMFKMSDGYLVAYNKTQPPQDQLQRDYINSTYEAYRKKKEALTRME